MCHRVIDDCGGEDTQLVTDQEECSSALLHLLLTGKAVRYHHNGSVLYDDNGKLLVCKMSMYMLGG